MVSGPSFLGLADEPRNSLDYLLEDEPSAGHGRLYLVLLLLILLGGAGAWYWWSGELPWQALGRLTSAVSGTEATSVAPAPPGLTTPATTPSASPMPSEPAADAASPEPAAAMAKKDETATAQGASVPVSTPPAKTADEGQAASEVSGASTSPAEPATPSTAAAPLVKRVPPPPMVAKPVPAQPTAAPVSLGDKLVADGERYLYGNGARQDCDRAQKNLLAAARQADSKAYPLLGAMYATGHCVTRDLPTAYRWFARALHQDPGNARVQRDLEVLWNQMTPQERQIATRAQ